MGQPFPDGDQKNDMDQTEREDPFHHSLLPQTYASVPLIQPHKNDDALPLIKQGGATRTALSQVIA